MRHLLVREPLDLLAVRGGRAAALAGPVVVGAGVGVGRVALGVALALAVAALAGAAAATLPPACDNTSTN